MTAGTIAGHLVTLVPVDPGAALALVSGDAADLGGLRAGRGWPHADTMSGLRGGLAAAGSGTWFVTVAVDGVPTVVGDCGTKGPPDADGRVEIGYGLAAPSRGLGYGRDLVRCLAQALLGRPDVRAVVAEVLAENLPSRRALEGAGFTVDRVEVPFVWYVRESPDGVTHR